MCTLYHTGLPAHGEGEDGFLGRTAPISHESELLVLQYVGVLVAHCKEQLQIELHCSPDDPKMHSKDRQIVTVYLDQADSGITRRKLLAEDCADRHVQNQWARSNGPVTLLFRNYSLSTHSRVHRRMSLLGWVCEFFNQDEQHRSAGEKQRLNTGFDTNTTTGAGASCLCLQTKHRQEQNTPVL